MRKIDLTDFRVATSETARDINRRIVLNLIRKHQPVSRADLSRHSGLQRSTVSLITEKLISEHWVMEGARGHLPRGRKPTFLHLNHERAGVIGVDIRPIKTTIVLAGLDSEFLAQDSLPTGSEPGHFIEVLGRRIRNLTKTRPEMTYEGIGVSLPGRIDARTHRLVFAPNLGWKDVEVKEPLEAATGLPVEIENAANACALAEFWGGEHGEGVRDLIAVTVSEGIGVGMILNGQLVRGSTGMAGEFGHVTLMENGPLCSCGNHGCWEACASNTATIRYYTSTTNGNRNHRPVSHLPSFDDILNLAEQGDVKAQAALDQSAHYLGAGLAMLVAGFAPDVLIVFGEVTRAWDRVGTIINEVVEQRLPTEHRTRIVPTDPLTQPRLRGTNALVLQKHFSAPSVA